MADYMDVVCRPDASVSGSALLSGLFEQLHGEFVSRKLSTVGVCFPDAASGLGLGTRLRLHGPEAILISLGEMAWLRRASDYYLVRPPRSVPAEHTLRIVRRVQPKLSAAKVRRLVARGSATEQEAEVLLKQRSSSIDAPYVQIRSGSSGQRFRLFFEQVPADADSNDSGGGFSAYGLGAVIPWF